MSARPSCRVSLLQGCVLKNCSNSLLPYLNSWLFASAPFVYILDWLERKIKIFTRSLWTDFNRSLQSYLITSQPFLQNYDVVVTLSDSTTLMVCSYIISCIFFFRWSCAIISCFVYITNVFSVLFFQLSSVLANPRGAYYLHATLQILLLNSFSAFKGFIPTCIVLCCELTCLFWTHAKCKGKNKIHGNRDYYLTVTGLML